MNKKYILITGASSGIGKSLAYEFAKRGEKLILVARRMDILEEFKKEFPETIIFKADLSDLDQRSRVLLVGGGIGVPPLLEVAKLLNESSVEVTTVLGFATKEAVILEDELSQYSKVFVTTDDGSYGIKGNVSVVIKELDSEFDAVYSCGAPGMMKYINQTFYEHPRAYLSLESRMACGMGACYACVLKVPDSETVSQRVCEDGPVFKTGTVVL